MRAFLLLILVLMSGAVSAQSSRKNKTTAEQGVPNSLNPNYSNKNYGPAKNASSGTKKESRKSKTSSITYDAEKNYYGRMEAVAKARRKTEKEMQKPQYSDPMYFGHKRPPKKRPPHKMKFCKECGIRH